MEVQVVLDNKGKVVAAIYRPKPEPEEHDKPIPRAGPVIEDGQSLVELGIPDEYASYPLPDFVDRLTAEAEIKLAGAKGKKK